MALLQNVLPKDNPLAIKIPVNTVINGVALNPIETYTVSVDKISYVAKDLNNPNIGYTTKAYQANVNSVWSNKNIQYIILSDTFFFKIYMPLFDNGNYIYLVPAFIDPNYEHQGLRDMTNLNQVSPIISNYNEPNRSWSEALESWLFDMNGYFKAVNKPTKTTLISKDITFTITGYITKRTDETIKTKATLQALAKKYGV